MAKIWKVNLKLVILLTLCASSLLIFYYAENKAVFINFFFIPTLLAGYIYDARGGVITALASITFVILISFMSFENYIEFITKNILLWGCFLIVSGYLIGTLTQQVTGTYLGTISTLALAMESRDPYTYGHSSHVADVAVRIARKLGLSKAEQDNIKTAGMLHDIGKFGVREDILRKSGPLTKEEYDHIKQHPLIGASILSPVRLLKSVIPYIYYHHEFIDGSGYYHKKGSDIPLGARILAVSDAYSAMSADRPYRKALSREEILKVFKEKGGRQYDKKVVDTLLDITNNLQEDIEPEKKA